MSSCIQPVYQTLNSLDYGWQLIHDVYVPVWYNSFQLPTQKEISHYQKKNYKITTDSYFQMKSVIEMKI